MKHFFAALLLPVSAIAADPLLDLTVVTSAMKKAVGFYSSKLAVHGGYASSWKKDLSAGKSEHEESKTITSIQPPGTTSVGLTMLKAYQATGDETCLKAARAAAHSLVECQLASGGWSSDFNFDPEKAKKHYLRSDLDRGEREIGKRRNDSTLDDNKTQSALLFLLEISHDPACADDAGIKSCTKFALEALLAAQAPNGGWPQQFSGPADATAPVVKASYPAEWSRTWPNIKYTGFYTLNDGNLQQVAKVLERAYELDHDERCLAAFKKLGDFFILAQMPEPQPVWAQQYDREMHPVWARKFEPASVTGYESIGAMETLHTLWVLTGDEKYLAPIPSALAWFERSKLPDGKHARFYELQSNKPLYFIAEKYELTYDDSNIPTHYSFTEDQQDNLDDFNKWRALSREEIQRKRAGPTTEKEWTSKAKGVVGKVTKALKAQQAEGYWLNGDEIDTGEFCKAVNAMVYYIDAAKKGGEEFAKQLK